MVRTMRCIHCDCLLSSTGQEGTGGGKDMQTAAMIHVHGREQAERLLALDTERWLFEADSTK